jgi:N-acetyl-gamma-glutamyl-phosphate reductase
MINVGVMGATGYAGAELVRILSGHPLAELAMVTSRTFAGQRFDSAYPGLKGHVDLICEPFSIDQVCERCDIVFLALPHKIPMEIVPELLERGKKVIDLSADFRFANVSTYEAHYQPHTAASYVSKAVYGLCEVYKEQIRSAALIGNPGCYPTSVLLPLIPLLTNKLINPATIIADAKSGVSGAGRSPSLTVHFCEVNESFKPYKVAQHRHTPEMEEVLSREAGQPICISFVPHLVPMTRGMLTTIYANLEKNVDFKAVDACLNAYYHNFPFIRIRSDGSIPDTLHVRGSNYCDIGFKVDYRTNRLILISAIDNLVKGAAGQAVQNMNIMTGQDETTGLTAVPLPL